MQYFLLVYDRATGSLLRDPAAFAAGEREAALTLRFAVEKEYRDNTDVEVVVLGAESRDDLLRTHARYFKSVSELAEAGSSS